MSVRVDRLVKEVVSRTLIALSLCSTAFAQQIGNPRLVCSLPSQLTESSGLIIEDENLFWTHNDGGSQPVMYAFDTTGALVDSIVVTNSTNTDWEALANDGIDRYFIGDFGNNGNDRTDLRIYISDSIGLSDSLVAEVLNFSYPDQIAFPASASFDMEGFFYFGDSLYLFSKNKLFGGNGFTKLYSLPADSGTYSATLIDSLNIGVVVTGADISPSGNMVALMSYGRITLLENFAGRNFLNGSQRYIIIPISQTESVAFLNDSILYFTNEGGYLFTISVSEAPTGAPLVDWNWLVTFDDLEGTWSIRDSHGSAFELRDMTGRVVSSGITGKGETKLAVRDRGVYYLLMSSGHWYGAMLLSFP